MAAPHHLVVTENVEALHHAALRLFVSAAERAIAERGSFAVALAGGSTPQALYELLAQGFPWQPPEPPQWPFDWNNVQIFFGDERCVPPDHEDSNYKMAFDALLSKVPIPPENIHRMRGEIPPTEAAKEYGLLLKSRFGDDGLDLIFLGMGADGHTASLFPHSEALAEMHHRCVAHFIPNSTTGASWRMTLTVPFLNKAREILVLVSGSEKAARLAEVLHGPQDPSRLPIQFIHPTHGKLVWIVDEPAAAELKR